jgi:predicted esterase
VGDPPHETPGWYSVYDSDASTQTVISAHARRMAELTGGGGGSNGARRLLPRAAPYARSAGIPYLLYLPPEYSPEAPWPLVVGLHGSGGRAQHCIDLWRAYADAGRFVLLCPELSDEHGDWNHDTRKAQVMAAVQDARGAVSLLPKMIVAGFSRGAYLAQHIAYAYPGELAGVALMAAVQYDPPPAGAAPVPFLVIIGDIDHGGGVEQVATFTGQLQAAGFPAEKRILPGVGHAVTPAMSEFLLAFVRTLYPA